MHSSHWWLPDASAARYAPRPSHSPQGQPQERIAISRVTLVEGRRVSPLASLPAPRPHEIPQVPLAADGMPPPAFQKRHNLQHLRASEIALSAQSAGIVLRAVLRTGAITSSSGRRSIAAVSGHTMFHGHEGSGGEIMGCIRTRLSARIWGDPAVVYEAGATTEARFSASVVG